MDAAFQSRAEVLAREFAVQARTIEDVNELIQLMMKSALERMLDTEMDVHLGRRRWAEPDQVSMEPRDASACAGRRGVGVAGEESQPPQRPLEEDGAQR